jgi:ubiquinone/menaquinone biosynthesis C-methylase UbiE
MSSQKEIFLKSEADAWFERNHQAILSREFNDKSPIISELRSCLDSFPQGGGQCLLEIGCGEAKRLNYIENHLGIKCFGIEPSFKAVEHAVKNGINVTQGTADKLNFESNKFDFVVFGFCLYLCDRDDLFLIASEADRVLKNEGWVLIHDFFSKMPQQRDYHHLSGIHSFKMDYRKLFDWHPSYTCYSQNINHHGDISFTDDPNQWVATSVLRKKVM